MDFILVVLILFAIVSGFVFLAGATIEILVFIFGGHSFFVFFGGLFLASVLAICFLLWLYAWYKEE